MKELNRTSRHATGDARQSGNLVKDADGPWQTKRKPSNRDAERGKLSALPHQLVIDFSPFQPARHNPHSSVARVVLKERKPAEHE